ncbi:MAG: hypothetical protein QOG49_1144, partial [Frankiaceae bacterium]|nr:hypothetical protein [Frankiaceae bacterium]
MLFELRLAVDDRPGSLAALTALLAQQDIDIREIDFLGSAAGAAVDNVLIEASALQLETVREALADLDGFEILSTRPSGRLGGTQPELELLLGVARARGNGLEQFAAGCPRVLSADWAVTFTADSERPRLRTLIAPDVERQGRLPLRAAAVELTSGAYKVAGPPTT